MSFIFFGFRKKKSIVINFLLTNNTDKLGRMSENVEKFFERKPFYFKTDNNKKKKRKEEQNVDKIAEL